MTRGGSGIGSVRPVKNRRGEIIGFQALLPRDKSTPPDGCRNPENYQEPLGPRQPTADAARRLLKAAAEERRAAPTLAHGLPVAHYVDAAIKARAHELRREGHRDGQIKTWSSIARLWLPKAAWHQWPPSSVQVPDVQQYVDYLTTEAVGRDGEPLSGSFVRQIGSLLRATFERAGIAPNPAALAKFPPKGGATVPYLDLSAQRRLFRDEDITLADRVMIGCGMGAGLRVGELLSIEIDDARIDDHDPHLIVRYGGPDQSPTKGRRVRRVELVEPGLGFWARWLRDHYTGGVRVFGGPHGGYQKHWPENFPTWRPGMTSHIMRHTYAVSMLSGTWGYEPRSLEFVQVQLGHRERSTTERYYGAFEVGVWQREVRRMTGRETVAREIVTSEALLPSQKRPK